MNNVYIRSKDNLKNIMFKTILALIPLILAGFYKNGIKLYINDYVSFYAMLKPLIFDLLGFIIGIIVNIIYSSIIKKDLSIKESCFSSFHPLYGILIASIISINTRIWLFSLVTFIFLLISKFINKNNINIIALTSLSLIFITKFIYGFTFLNVYEQSNTLNLVALDYLIGRGSGGINTSHVLLLAFSLIILCNIRTFKKEIPIYSSATYSLCMIVYCTLTNQIGFILDNIFANGILFSFVFVATDSLSSSYTNKGKIIYSIIIGIATFGLFLVYPPLSAMGGILIASICHKTIDNLVLKNMAKK